MVSLGEAGGKIVRPWLGINMQRVTPDLASGFGLARPAGLVVKEVYSGGPGYKAGLKRNDVIGDPRPADRRRGEPALPVATLTVDTVVPVKVIRGGKEVVVDLKLAAPPEDPPRDRSLLEGRQRSPAPASSASPAVADELGLVEYSQRRHRHRGQAGRLCRPLRQPRHDRRGQRPGREERRRSQEEGRRRLERHHQPRGHGHTVQFR